MMTEQNKITINYSEKITLIKKKNHHVLCLIQNLFLALFKNHNQKTNLGLNYY